jgi:hypothetical protein
MNTSVLWNAPSSQSTESVLRGEVERDQARRIREGQTLRQQTAFDDYLAQRAADPSWTFRQHLRRTGGAIEE